MPNSTKDRRRGPDILIKGVQIIGFICSTLAILSMLIVDRAKPRIETFFDRLLGVQLYQDWDSNLLDINFYIVVSIFFLSAAGLLVNSQRTRRKVDRYNRSLIFLATIALFTILFFKTHRFF